MKWIPETIWYHCIAMPLFYGFCAVIALEHWLNGATLREGWKQALDDQV